VNARRWLWVRAGVSVALLGWLFLRVDWAVVAAQVRRVPGPALLLAWLLFWGAFALANARWARLVRAGGLAVPWWTLFRIKLVGFFWTQFLPSTVGGDGYRILALRGQAPNATTVVVLSVLLDRGYGYLALLLTHDVLFVLLWAWGKPLPSWVQAASWALVGLSVVVVGLGLWILADNNRLARALRRLRAPTAAARLRTIHRQEALPALLFSFAFVVVAGLTLAVLLWALGVQVDGLTFFYAYTFSLLAATLPISLNGLGLLEASMLAILHGQGLDFNALVTALGLWRFVQWSAGLLGGVVSLFARTARSREVSSRR